MTRDEAKAILALYRPESSVLPDAEMADALERVKQDAELRAWFEAHCAAQSATRAAFRSIKAPEGLKEQILSERTRPVPRFSWRKPVRLALLTALLLAFVVVVTQWIDRVRIADDLGYAAFRSRMVGTALRQYGMDLETNNLAAIRAHLAQQQARADFTLPEGLTTVTATGCGVLNWQGNRVSMVCFRSGRPLREGEQTDLFLFVMRRTAASDAPNAAKPQFTPENRLMTASWSEGDLVYLLATEGEEQTLRKYF